MAAVTPFAGLLKWCVLSPLYHFSSERDDLHIEKELYNKLHLALLESLREAGPVTGPSLVVSVQHLISVIPPLQLKVAEHIKVEVDMRNDPLLQVSNRQHC